MEDYLVGGKLDELALKVAQWRDRKGFDTGWDIVPEKLMLVVTELAEAMEEYRKLDDEALDSLYFRCLGEDKHVSKDTWDILDKFEDEIADTFIRLLDLCGSLCLELEYSINRKMTVNENRPHKHGKCR
jgi:NTP pyrophosphatase (non-canonical NTP hydrolase)